MSGCFSLEVYHNLRSSVKRWDARLLILIIERGGGMNARVGQEITQILSIKSTQDATL
jgi:hypothetical protein